ncbi:agmatine deiminase family protein [Campylobacter fetus]|uniref:Agmatine deiminase n=3 Tax=Campylobacter fetus TaxID=196 RepID=A0AAE6M9M5_CAMFE|nr:agmatine deiminase family protein [Campylobacter fetus]OCS22301.1 peptidyl-arginine deiminase [Campylobacter fetus subsp. venerealis cfvi97/532]OCS26102.1 peptidyl-arginine deiminase [Campylobacter fetus subsp. venerealis cfvB10]OCS29387.1 peptidyl-arginine deiminase [Campylobacter fetus subsp. venerealis LMG 6570 = CCUG 33900]OCS42774.1 peptidyl-arginine deiminase [Campylobacter fetus subsp. venerealis cfvi02/298]ABK83392.1 peptidyl-arginine deiminase, Porphyromonas-type [Campylobacter fet
MIQTYAEWDEQELLMLSIPHSNSDWKPYLNDILTSYEELISAVSSYQKLLLIAPQKSDFDRFSKFKNVEFLEVLTNDTWIRDYGAIDVKCGLKTISYDFKFNAWGGKFESSLDNDVNKKLFSHLKGELVSIPLILEGGSIEFNGDGVLLTTTSCLLNDNRNSLSKNELEIRLKELFGLKKIIWLEHGFIKGDDTDSHIDTLARFISKDTIAYASCTDKNDEHYLPLKEMENELKKTGFNLVPLELPKPVMFEGRRLGATYCNFIFVNGALIVPTYGDKKSDELALSTLKQVLNLDIIGVDSTVFIRQNGSLHCSSQNRFKGDR